MTPDIETLIERLEGLRVELEERDRPHSARLIEETQAALRAVQWRPISEAPKRHDDLLLSDGVKKSQGGWLSQVDQGAEYEGQCGAPSPGWWSVDGIEEPTHFIDLKALPLPAARASNAARRRG